MSVRLNLVLSEDLNNEIEQMASKGHTNKSEIIRKALQLFLAAQEGKSRGLSWGWSSLRPGRCRQSSSVCECHRP